MVGERNSRLPAALILGAAIIASALVFLGYRVAGDKAGKWTEQQLTALIDQRIESHGPAGLSDEAFNRRVEAGIEAFIRKRREAQAKAAESRASNLKAVDPATDHIRGAPDARITLIEYSDFECPYCKRFHPTAQKLVNAYNGRVNWVYRHFPLGFHNPGAQKEAEASECAAELGGNKAFWRFADSIYERTRSNGNGFPVSQLTPLAAKLGLDEARFRDCLDSGRHAAKVKRHIQEGEAAGVRGTPGNFLVDHKTGRIVAIAGARPFEDVKRAVDGLLAE